MLSLRFQQSTPSLLSYWSDNMSVGPNLPLHTLSKPAIRFLYQLQVKKFIKATEKYPLSEYTMEVFDSYLRYKYISSATKCMIIEHLHARLESLELEECFSTMEMVFRCSPGLVDPQEWTSFSDLLSIRVFSFQDVASTKLHNWVKKNLRREVWAALKYFSFTYRHCVSSYYLATIMPEITKSLRFIEFEDIPSFMSNGLSLIANIHDISARTAAFDAIFQRTWVKYWPPKIEDFTLDIFTPYTGIDANFSMQLLDEIAAAGSSDRARISIMESLADQQDLVPNLLQDAACRFGMCEALANLAQTEAASIIMLELKLHLFLVQLLSDANPVVSQCAALRVLDRICVWFEGAEAVVFETDMLQIAKKLFRSEETFLATGHCLRAIAQHNSTYPSILSDSELIKPLVLCLSKYQYEFEYGDSDSDTL
ncbi:hypothetical protein R3P38DRAFT_3617052 [Favolaschia claudopus]|uniref:Uncharacterized protein n=1 Tax=Favolaschia claudopus TaxID=2862362 RepID=A0AAW0A399_9AGAR